MQTKNVFQLQELKSEQKLMFVSDWICQVKSIEHSSVIHDLANPSDLVLSLNNYISTNYCRALVNPIPDITRCFESSEVNNLTNKIVVLSHIH